MFGGGDDCPLELSPQHRSVPSDITPQVWRPPADRWRTKRTSVSRLEVTAVSTSGLVGGAVIPSVFGSVPLVSFSNKLANVVSEDDSLSFVIL